MFKKFLSPINGSSEGMTEQEMYEQQFYSSREEKNQIKQ